ncbi:hypothetical protein [Morganella morganii]|uniref:hypothetical protein n=1 Tax=Morganella morganii TaxID=582 RepID=UPI001BDB415C|nr:hypothetical protein [Morganella morganii]MBT0422962.1 hypothetical protein [Morganella morganii subsp. morganii]MBT0517560.1 hypothetical protein [Morganella morganii subsp. morganii]QWM05657.1 hypothetical protein IZ185_08140 [Morganella morganii subsp. morganii]
MNIEFECESFSGVARVSTGNVLLQVNGATLNGCVDTSDIIEEYSAEVLLDVMDDADIIKYLTRQGYTVTDE